MRNQVLATVAAVAGLAVGGGLARADSPEREVAAKGASEGGDFAVIVMRGSTVSRVTGSDGGILSEVTIREDPAPARPEALEEPGRAEVERLETRTVQVLIVERAVPVSLLSFVPERDHRFGHRRHTRIRGGLGRSTPARSVATLRAERGRTMKALAAGSWPATPSLARFRQNR